MQLPTINYQHPWIDSYDQAELATLRFDQTGRPISQSFTAALYLATPLRVYHSSTPKLDVMPLDVIGDGNQKAEDIQGLLSTWQRRNHWFPEPKLINKNARFQTISAKNLSKAQQETAWLYHILVLLRRLTSNVPYSTRLTCGELLTHIIRLNLANISYAAGLNHDRITVTLRIDSSDNAPQSTYFYHYPSLEVFLPVFLRIHDLAQRINALESHKSALHTKLRELDTLNLDGWDLCDTATGLIYRRPTGDPQQEYYDEAATNVRATVAALLGEPVHYGQFDGEHGRPK